jgi:hypothetical protein
VSVEALKKEKDQLEAENLALHSQVEQSQNRCRGMLIEALT